MEFSTNSFSFKNDESIQECDNGFTGFNSLTDYRSRNPQWPNLPVTQWGINKMQSVNNATFWITTFRGEHLAYPKPTQITFTKLEKLCSNPKKRTTKDAWGFSPSQLLKSGCSSPKAISSSILALAFHDLKSEINTADLLNSLEKYRCFSYRTDLTGCGGYSRITYLVIELTRPIDGNEYNIIANNVFNEINLSVKNVSKCINRSSLWPLHEYYFPCIHLDYSSENIDFKRNIGASLDCDQWLHTSGGDQ